MKYAVIKTGGKQYRISEGDVIEVDRLSEEAGGKVFFNDVLLLVLDNSVKIGKPNLSGEKVLGKVLDHVKADKIRVSKFKSKVRYRRITGFRASLSKVQIETLGGGKSGKKKEITGKTGKKKS